MADALSGVAQAAAVRKQAATARLQRRQMQPLIDAQTGLAQTLGENAKTLSPYIGQYYQRSLEGFDPAFEHYKALASGDRTAVMGAVAPQLADIGSRYGSLISASRELSPRSGASASYNTDLGFRAADEGQRVIDTERASAYPNLVKMAGVAGDLGSGAAGVATGAGAGAGGLLNGALGANQLMAGNARQLAADQAAAYAEIAKGLYAAYQKYGSSNGKGGSGKTGDAIDAYIGQGGIGGGG